MCRKVLPKNINDELGISRTREDEGMEVPRFSRASFIFDDFYLERRQISMGQLFTNYYHDSKQKDFLLQRVKYLLNKLHQSDICD